MDTTTPTSTSTERLSRAQYIQHRAIYLSDHRWPTYENREKAHCVAELLYEDNQELLTEEGIRFREFFSPFGVIHRLSGHALPYESPVNLYDRAAFIERRAVLYQHLDAIERASKDARKVFNLYPRAGVISRTDIRLFELREDVLPLLPMPSINTTANVTGVGEPAVSGPNTSLQHDAQTSGAPVGHTGTLSGGNRGQESSSATGDGNWFLPPDTTMPDAPVNDGVAILGLMLPPPRPIEQAIAQAMSGTSSSATVTELQPAPITNISTSTAQAMDPPAGTIPPSIPILSHATVEGPSESISSYTRPADDFTVIFHPLHEIYQGIREAGDPEEALAAAQFYRRQWQLRQLQAAQQNDTAFRMPVEIVPAYPFVPDEGLVHCLCGDHGNQVKSRVGCSVDGCLLLQHYDCMGITEEEYKEMQYYACHRCDPFRHREQLRRLRALAPL